MAISQTQFFLKVLKEKTGFFHLTPVRIGVYTMGGCALGGFIGGALIGGGII